MAQTFSPPASPFGLVSPFLSLLSSLPFHFFPIEPRSSSRLIPTWGASPTGPMKGNHFSPPVRAPQRGLHGFLVALEMGKFAVKEKRPGDMAER